VVLVCCWTEVRDISHVASWTFCLLGLEYACETCPFGPDASNSISWTPGLKVPTFVLQPPEAEPKDHETDVGT
jgi:hypothetical protein